MVHIPVTLASILYKQLCTATTHQVSVTQVSAAAYVHALLGAETVRHETCRLKTRQLKTRQLKTRQLKTRGLKTPTSCTVNGMYQHRQAKRRLLIYVFSSCRLTTLPFELRRRDSWLLQAVQRAQSFCQLPRNALYVAQHFLHLGYRAHHPICTTTVRIRLIRNLHEIWSKWPDVWQQSPRQTHTPTPVQQDDTKLYCNRRSSDIAAASSGSVCSIPADPRAAHGGLASHRTLLTSAVPGLFAKPHTLFTRRELSCIFAGTSVRIWPVACNVDRGVGSIGTIFACFCSM